jgi:PAS domain S-box-containing protein
MGPSFIYQQLGVSGLLLLGVLERNLPSKPIPNGRRLELGSVLRALSDPVLLLDERGDVVDLNAAAEQLTDCARSELLCTSAEQLLHDHAGEQHSADSILSRALQGECVHKGVHWLRKPGADPSTVSLTLSPVCDSSGSIAGAVLTIRDITEEAHLRDELAQSQRHVAVGEMTAGLVHDFSNVFSTINDAVMVLEADSKDGGHDRVVLGIIRNAVHRGVETLGNVRKYLAGKRERSRVEVRRLLEEVLELTNPVLHKHTGITVVREMESCGEVNANQDELRRAFTNLVLNALEAMPQSGTLTVACRRIAGRVLVSVRDTGTGMSPEVQKKIFSSYFTTKPQGTGLGLAGARRSIQAQGGEIKFESAPGKGTTFYVTLPIASAQEKKSAEPTRLAS